MSTAPFKLPSFAKINWSLQILGRRPDGYHEVRTTLQTVSLQDDLHFSARADETVHLSCNDRQIPVDKRNLIIRAANALRDGFDIHAGATVHLEKRIPTQAGLGGASSNAAIALLGLAHLWHVNVGISELKEIGSRLGADVPFFFVGGCALATGIGADVTPSNDRPPKHLLILKPPASVSTKDAYRALNVPALTTTNGASILSSSAAGTNSADSDPWTLHNDFETIFETEPEIARAKKALMRSGASDALLAGSGSSVFGIFDNEQSQGHALREIQTEAGWRVFPAVTISRLEYRQALALDEGSLLSGG